MSRGCSLGGIGLPGPLTHSIALDSVSGVRILAAFFCGVWSWE